MALHVNQTDPDLHECKGVAAAGANRMQVSDGAGSASWVPITTYTPVNIAYGEIYLQDNTNATTCTTQNTFYKVAGTYTAGDATNITTTGNKFTVITAGVYLCTCSFSAYNDTSGSDQTFAFGFSINQADPTISFARYMTDASGAVKPGLGHITTIKSLSAADELEFYVTCESAASKDVVVRDANMTVLLLKES